MRTRSRPLRKQKTLAASPSHAEEREQRDASGIFLESDHIKKHYVKIPDGTRNHLDTLSRARRLHRGVERFSAWALCKGGKEKNTRTPSPLLACLIDYKQIRESNRAEG